MSEKIPSFKMKTCQKHGLQKHVAEKRCNTYSYYRCIKCRSEAVQRRREKVKIKAVEYKGGKCELCGYNKCVAALDFHHNDYSEKDFGIAKNGHCRSWERVRKELDKCSLLCANCHREIHAKTPPKPRDTIQPN